MKCNLCKRKVRDSFEAKMNHVWKYHPQVPLSRLMAVFLNPAAVERLGEWFGKQIRNAIQ